ncbi:MAG: CRISPR-associated endoribonuclease Cas6 [Acholeplasmataceae bacterium]|jgi:CRISPR-associated endoribonuclease Cas6
MRLILTFKTENEKITNQYRNFLMSYFKAAYEKEYKTEFSKQYDSLNEPHPFTFSVYIKDLKHEGSYIIAPDKEIKMVISSNDYTLINILYNSLLMNRNKQMNINPDNKIWLERLSLRHLKQIETKEIKIKMLSPLLVRVRDASNNLDYYKTIEDEDYMEHLNFNLKYLTNLFKLNQEDLEIKPLKAKKVVVPIMKVRYDATTGTFLLKGNQETLNTLYRIGIGSRRSEGFGMFEII